MGEAVSLPAEPGEWPLGARKPNRVSDGDLVDSAVAAGFQPAEREGPGFCAG